MQIINKTAGTKSISVTPRSDNFTSMTLYNETTNATVSVANVSLVASNYYMTLAFDIENDLQDDVFYYLTMYNGSTPIYRDKIYVTSQSAETYTINQNVYVSHSSNDEFITL